jgi:hypothetical protein
MMASAALMAMLAGPAPAVAEPTGGPIAAAVARLSFPPGTGAAAGEREAPTPYGAIARARTARQPVAGDPPVTRSRGKRVGRAIAGAAVGAVGGAFAGGYLGAAIDGDCGGCDDPGLKGFLIGFPVGGVVGGVLGGFYLFR